MTSRNPWLDIPETDYVGHMTSPEVGQRQALNAIFSDVLTRYPRTRLLVLGCGNGNGFEHIDPRATLEVTGIDINPRYLDTLRARHAAVPFRLTLECADLDRHPLPVARFDLVHAALVFEYLDWTAVLTRVASSLAPRGVLSVVLQEPSRSAPAVTRTAYSSLLRLESRFRFVPPTEFCEVARSAGLILDTEHRVPLPGGKNVHVVSFRRGAPL